MTGHYERMIPRDLEGGFVTHPPETAFCVIGVQVGISVAELG